jgi:hypothetical protein
MPILEAGDGFLFIFNTYMEIKRNMITQQKFRIYSAEEGKINNSGK